MAKLVVRNDKLLFNNLTFQLSDLFTNEFYEYSNRNVTKYNSELPIVNEVYLKYTQPVMAVEFFIKQNKIKLVDIYNIDDSLLPIIVDASKNQNIKIIGEKRKLNFNKIIGHLYLIATCLFLILKMVLIPYYKNRIPQDKKFSVIRTPAAHKKMKSISEVNIELEDINSKNSIYKHFKKRKRILWVVKSWIKSYSVLNKYTSFIEEKVGLESAINSYPYYGKRITHTILYQYVLDSYFSLKKDSIFYTGNNLDRFAIIEEKIAEKYNIRTVCIPHGLEFGFMLPYGFTSELFYTTSKKAAEHLNFLYDTEKFRYDEGITSGMFTLSPNTENNKKNIVYFTEPREVNVNIEIIDELLSLLEKDNIHLYIKLHPKDKKNHYKRFENRISFIEDFKEALINNICLARKSTILLEAVYNDSKAAAILINEKDIAIFNTFPSLQDENINRFYDISELYIWLRDLKVHEV